MREMTSEFKKWHLRQALEDEHNFTVQINGSNHCKLKTQILQSLDGKKKIESHFSNNNKFGSYGED